MMPDTTARRGPAAPPLALSPSTRFRTGVHTPVHMTHTVHTAVPGIPCAAAPGVDEAAPAARSVHTVRFLVHMARWAAPTAGGALLVSGGLYAGPLSVVPVPVLLALAAVGWAVPLAAPALAGGDR